MAEFLLGRGYEVHGMVRQSSSRNTQRIDHILDQMQIHSGDLSDFSSLLRIVEKICPDEIYNFAGQSHVRVSFELPRLTADVVAMGPLRLLEAIRQLGLKARFYQASSSEMFGNAPSPQDERTSFHPCSPYACSKVFAHHTTVNYRESYGIYAVSGIGFNHESPRRGEQFVTRKVTKAIARIKKGVQDRLLLGNLEARRDWGFAGDYVQAMWLMMQQPQATDYVIGTGESHTVRSFVISAFESVGLHWWQFVESDPSLFRPTEVDCLRADSSKLRKLGWAPKVCFEDLVRMMVEADLKLLIEK